MLFPEKSYNFAKKILKHYPVPQQSHTCLSDHCHSHQPQSFQPFQHMHDHRKQRQIYQKPTKQKLQNMKYFKQMGNNYFKQIKYEQAVFFYNKALLYSDYTFPQKEQQIRDMEILVQQSNMNMAICLIKLNNWSKAVVNLRETVKGDLSLNDQKYRKIVLNTRKKGYFWLTKYYIRQGNYNQANAQIKLLLGLDNQISSKQQVSQLKGQLNSQIKKHQKKIQDITKKMFKAAKQNQ